MSRPHTKTRPPGRPSRRRAAKLLGALVTSTTTFLPIRALFAQTDFFNLDAERPVVIEDALPVERHAFELQLAPVRVEGERNGTTIWSVVPELAYGILPRTDVSVHLPWTLRRGEAGDDDAGLSGVELALFHNLTRETLTLPAVALSGGIAFPVGGLASESTRGTLKAMATRSLTGPRRAIRIHANAEVGLGEEGDVDTDDETGNRWRAGVAVDRTFVFESFLVVGNAYAERPLVEDASTRWIAGAGIRYQVSPQFVVDAGFERRLGEEGPDWALTFGTANAFAIRSLIPTGGR